jgi:hypothetical protein
VIVTENQASELWCPQSGERPGNPTCIGSRCMAWCWTTEYPHRQSKLCSNQGATSEPLRPPSVPESWVFTPAADGDPADWSEPAEVAAARRKGFCGLAQ